MRIDYTYSFSGHRCVPSSSGVYSASKFAVRALTESLRSELRQIKSNIRATVSGKSDSLIPNSGARRVEIN